MNLNELGQKHKTDKCDKFHTYKGLSYLNYFETYFAPKQNKNINLLEIGVRGGNSLRLWKEYFPNGNIFGLDIDPNCKQYEQERISIEIGSQDNVESINNILQKAKTGFDIIIDDGSHLNDLIVKSFNILVPHLNPYGVYIIEDLSNSYKDLTIDSQQWPGMQYTKQLNANLNNNRETLNVLFFKLIQKMDSFQDDILSINFHPMICVIQKGNK